MSTKVNQYFKELYAEQKRKELPDSIQLDRLIAFGVDLTFAKENKCPFCGPKRCCSNPECEYRKEYLNESKKAK